MACAKQCLSRLWPCLWEKEKKSKKKNISSYIYGLFVEWWKFYKPINMVLFLWNTSLETALHRLKWIESQLINLLQIYRAFDILFLHIRLKWRNWNLLICHRNWKKMLMLHTVVQIQPTWYSGADLAEAFFKSNDC